MKTRPFSQRPAVGAGSVVRSGPSLIDADVTVVLPTLGRETLQLSVRSALAQEPRPREVVVALDPKAEGSARGWADALSPMGDACGVDIRVVASAAGGASATRMAGVNEAHAQNVAFLDDDDRWLSGHLTRALICLANGTDVYCSRSLMRLDHRPSRPHPRRVYPGRGGLGAWMYRSPTAYVARRAAGIPFGTVVLATALARSVPMSHALQAREDFAWLMDLETGGAVVRQFPWSDLLVQRSTARVEARKTAEQALIFAEHVERNSGAAAGLGFLLAEAASLARKGRSDEATKILRSLPQRLAG